MNQHHIAQLNITRLLAPIDSPELVDFVDNLDRINELAEKSPGFVWRLITPAGDTTGIDFFGSDHVVNISVWQSIEALHQFVYRSAHIEIMRRRQEWFHAVKEAQLVLWWVPAGHLPSVEEAARKLKCLREQGPSSEAFTFKKSFEAPQ